ncbi:MAG: Gfo/Idh/MocA family oxidoreductase [Phycisphaerae bacterium]|nr:Gfo/Idh/MocA family oxidoreductase [Phycisphaerae bacterium]
MNNQRNDNSSTGSPSRQMDRRSFLRSATAIGAGLALSPHILLAQDNPADDINVALLGAGEQGQVLTDACLKIPGVRFKAVCDIWTEYNLRKVSRRLKAYKHENNTYTDYQEMLASEKDLDAVIIATPDFWHADHAVACLRAGLDVYCEKEMSNTLEGARRIVLAAKETGKLLQVGHQRRSNPRYLHCYNKIIKEADMLGRITTINGQWNRAARPDLGASEKYMIDPATLEKYGFKDMHQFRNWRWYKGLGGGPIVDLGSHQIDIYNWFLDTNPKSVMAGGGTDYYNKQTHQWYDNVMAIYEYPTLLGTVRAFYQTITTNSSQGYYESFMGDQGTLTISESASRGAVYREPTSPLWDKWVKLGLVNAPVEEKKEEKPKAGVVLDVRETLAPPAYELPVTMDKLYHQPHLENFFDAIRGKAKLTCPAEAGYETAVTVLKVNEAVEAGRKLDFDPAEFKV